METSKVSIILTLVAGMVSTYLPTTIKRQLVFVNESVPWNKATAFCSSLNGNLLNEESISTKLMLERAARDWKPTWNSDDYWFGLYVANMTNSTLRWDGSCNEVDLSTHHSLSSLPVSLTGSKLCSKASQRQLDWSFEMCNVSLGFVCEKKFGRCDFERSTEVGACIKSFDIASVTSMPNRDECEEFCSAIPGMVGQGECWAVMYDPENNTCYPVIDEDPLLFDSSSFHKINCKNWDISNSSVVSWKRCFMDPDIFRGPVTAAAAITNEPMPVCTATLSTIIPTTLSNVSSESTTATALTAILTTPYTTTPIIPTTARTSTPTTITSTVITANTTATVHVNSTLSVSSTTITSPTSAANASCQCTCKIVSGLTLDKKLDQLKQETTIDYKLTSSYKRKLICSPDERPVAKTIGMVVGTGIIITVLLLHVLVDTLTAVRHMFYYIKATCRD